MPAAWKNDIPVIGTACVYLAGLAIYISDFAEVGSNFRDFCADLGVGHFSGAAILGLPLIIIILGKLSKKVRRDYTLTYKGEDRNAGFRLSPFGSSPAEIEAYRARIRTDGLEQELTDWLAQSKEPLLFLTGQSGTGKSSIISAYVLPEIRATFPDNRAIYLRVFNDPMSDLFRALRELDSSLGTSGCLDTLQMCSFLLQIASNTSLIIVIDQFEEFLIGHDKEARQPFEDLIRSLCDEVIPNVKLLLICREDYLPELEQASFFLPQLRSKENWRQVRLFTQSAATQFIRQSSVHIGDRLLAKLLAEASEVESVKGLYRPIVLNMIGLALEREIQPHRPYFPLLRRKKNILRQLVENEIGNSPETRLLLGQMITDAGTKRVVKLEGLVKKTGVADRSVLQELRRMEYSGIVRRLDDQAYVWEVAHDYIARLLASILTTWKLSFWNAARPWLLPISSLLIILMISLPRPTENAIEQSIKFIRNQYPIIARMTFNVDGQGLHSAFESAQTYQNVSCVAIHWSPDENAASTEVYAWSLDLEEASAGSAPRIPSSRDRCDSGFQGVSKSTTRSTEFGPVSVYDEDDRIYSTIAIHVSEVYLARLVIGVRKESYLEILLPL